MILISVSQIWGLIFLYCALMLLVACIGITAVESSRSGDAWHILPGPQGHFNQEIRKRERQISPSLQETRFLLVILCFVVDICAQGS